MEKRAANAKLNQVKAYDEIMSCVGEWKLDAETKKYLESLQRLDKAFEEYHQCIDEYSFQSTVPSAALQKAAAYLGDPTLITYANQKRSSDENADEACAKKTNLSATQAGNTVTTKNYLSVLFNIYRQCSQNHVNSKIDALEKEFVPKHKPTQIGNAGVQAGQGNQAVKPNRAMG